MSNEKPPVDLSDESQLGIPKPDEPSMGSLMPRTLLDPIMAVARANAIRSEPLKDPVGNQLYQGTNGIISARVIYLWMRGSRIFLSSYPRHLSAEHDQNQVMTITPTHMDPDYGSPLQKLNWIENMCRVCGIALVRQ